MPKRTDIKSILLIGSGPIVIGQASEFDYSGTQACKVLREEGYRIVLVNSNPATIMTDPEIADATYIEPITPEVVTRIIEKERPHALLPTMGGQTALNTALALHNTGVLAKYNVELIGAKADVIVKAEDRLLFREAMERIGLESPRSRIVQNYDDAVQSLEYVGLPAIIRPSFTLGGMGGGIAYNLEEFEEIVKNGLDASPVNEVLIEQSVLGWKEYEMEVVRDCVDNAIIVCSIENIDPMGIHTGDSVTVAPAMTLTDKEYQYLRDASIACLREIGVDTGGSNVQFAVNPQTGDTVVIEMNPRVSRSSALASKATGFPIAKIAARLAVGYRLDELVNDMTGTTPASFEPAIDYIVTKIPRFAFEKFRITNPRLTTSMQSVGEVMAIGRSFSESLQKALCSLETGLTGLDEVIIPEAILEDGTIDKQAVLAWLRQPTPDRLLAVAQAFRHGLELEEIYDATKIDPWFLNQIAHIIAAENFIISEGIPEDPGALNALKTMGFSDARLATLSGQEESVISRLRAQANLSPLHHHIDSCAGEFPSATTYMYGAYEPYTGEAPKTEEPASAKEKVIILGGGPNRIGQGIEFDYCCVHAAYALKDKGYEAIMINCNPETVSTDYETSDRLYFDPLTLEYVIDIARKEQKSGKLKGLIVQFGGQTPLKLAKGIEDAALPILGTSPDAIDLAEDRERFQALLQQLKLKQPENGIARSLPEAKEIARLVGYPVLLRPSYVLGGRAMEIVYSEEELEAYMATAVAVSGKNPVLIDSYLKDAVEVDVDALCDGDEVFVAGIMEHIEEAGIHSGDSACSLPPHSLSQQIISEIEQQTKQLALAIKVKGLMNVQFAVQSNEVYILEVNPRASRTVPFVSKAIGLPLAKLATRVMAGEKLSDLGLDVRTPIVQRLPGHVSVKEAVFPFNRFSNVDPVLGPEMKSTGEVMGIDQNFPRAFLKAQMASGTSLPESGRAFISVKDSDKPFIAPLAKDLVALGFQLIATKGTAEYLEKQQIPVESVLKVWEGRPHILDRLISGDIHLVINTTEDRKAMADSRNIRRTALVQKIPYYTTIPGSRAAVQAIASLKHGNLEVAALQSYFTLSV